MKKKEKFFFSALILLISSALLTKVPVLAQGCGQIFCSAGTDPPCTLSGTYCEPGCVPPYPSGDSCLQYYQEYGTCPISIDCVSEPTETPIPTNTPTPTSGPTATPSPAGSPTSTPPPPTPSPQGGCATNNFHCDWSPASGCFVSLASWGCYAGFTDDDSVCTQHQNGPDCYGQVNNCCVEIYEEACYECVSTTDGCYPRDCNDPRAEFDDWESCNAVCTGQEEQRYRCENDQCIEDQNGPYYGISQCTWYCDNPRFAMLCPIGTNPIGGIETALGCIPTDARGFGIWMTSRGIIIAGGLAFLLMVFAGFQIITSSGDPKKLQSGQQLLTAAISGLLLIIFSIFLLRLIGVEILAIPGL